MLFYFEIIYFTILLEGHFRGFSGW